MRAIVQSVTMRETFVLGLRGETVDTLFEFLDEIETFSGGFFFHAKEDGVVDAMLKLALHLWRRAKEHFLILC